MAEELEEVTQRFDADMASYLADLEEASVVAGEFATANEEAAIACGTLRDDAAEAGVALGTLRDSAAEAGAANEAAGLSVAEMRDRLTEVAAAAGIYRDKLGKLRDSQDRFVADSALESMALGHERDEALEAAAAFKKLRDARAESVAAGGSGLLGSLFEEGGSGLGSIGPVPLPALLAIVPAVEALLPEIAGLVAGFAAAGAGAGAFALLAMPAFKSVSGAYQQIQSDQKAYDRALTATAKNNALKHLQQDYANLDPAQRGAVKGIQQLTGEYHKLSTAFEPEAFKIFNDVLQIANRLLPYVTPFAKTFADSLDGLLQKVAKFTGSTGFKDWLNQFHALEGPSITAIGDGLGKLAVSAGKLLTVMSSKDVVNAINIAFTILNGTIQGVTYMIKRLMDNWDGMGVAVRHSWYDIKRWTDDVTKVFDTVRHASAEFGHDWAGYFDTARHTVASWGHDTASTFDTVRHAIATGAHDIASAFDTVRHAVAILGHDIASGFDTIRHTIASWAGDVKTETGRVVSWFTELPGRIVHALGNLGALLVDAGRAIIGGLINGLESSLGGLGSFLGGVGSFIASHKGPIDVDRMLLVPHGHAMIAGLIDGIRAHLPALQGALAGVSGTVKFGVPGSSLAAGAVAPAGGGTPVHVTVPVTIQGSAAGAQSPEYLQGLQAAVQEAVLRYGQLNPGNGLTPAWGR